MSLMAPSLLSNPQPDTQLVPAIVQAQPPPRAQPDYRTGPQGGAGQAHNDSYEPSSTTCITRTQNSCCIPRHNSVRAALSDTQCTPCFTTAALDCVIGEIDSVVPSRGFGRFKERTCACLSCGPRIVPFMVLDVWLGLTYPLRTCLAVAMVPLNSSAAPAPDLAPATSHSTTPGV